MEALLSTQAVRRHRTGLAALVVAALIAHLLIFNGLAATGAGAREASAREASALTAAVQVRVVDEPVATADMMTPAVAAASPAPAALRPVRPTRPARPVIAAPARAVPVAAQDRSPPAIDLTPVAALTVIAPALPIVPAPGLAPAVTAAPDATPVYATQLPPALVLRYVMSRGALRGTGELTWKPAADHYDLALVGSVAGLMVLTQISSGGFDAAGVAPVRFTDQRLRRGTKAANFQRAANKISFSGTSAEFALRDGAQDRLSWMVQLGAIVAANPALRESGARIALYVVGPNGDASVWAFDNLGAESVSTGEGTVEALKFVREPREPYDTQVQVWMDATHHYLPVRATQKSGPDDDGFELRLQFSGPPP